MRRVAIVAGIAWLALALGSAVHAAPLTLGLFAPSAPFPSTAERVEFANRLGAELGKALQVPGSGRVYARAADFAAAVKKGEVTLALVDPAYLASPTASPGTSFVVIAVSRADDKAERTWQLVAHAGTRLAELKGRRVLVPSLGGHEAAFVMNVLLGGEVGRDFFAKIDPAPDTASALAALELGKADAAVVPMTGDLPGGTVEVLALPALSNPVLVVYGGLDRDAVLAASLAFKGDATIAGFSAADGQLVGELASRFRPPAKRGPFLVPAVRLLVGDLIEGRRFAIERTPVTAFTIAPAAR